MSAAPIMINWEQHGVLYVIEAIKVEHLNQDEAQDTNCRFTRPKLHN